MLRVRINKLLEESIKKPLTVVCANAGYGKTRAVYDFFMQEEETLFVVWIQLSEKDNIGSHFWENCVSNIAKVNAELAEKLRILGFPNTEDKLVQHAKLGSSAASAHSYLIVFDDVHLVTSAEVIRFLNNLICTLCDVPTNVSIIMICRELAHINITHLQIKELVSIISEDELKFTKNEVAQYLHSQELSLDPQVLNEIFEDTKGWAFSLNLVALLLKKTPVYSSYAYNTIKQNIFKLIETDIFNCISEKMRHFLIRLSLITTHTIDLIRLISFDDKSLMAELKRQIAYIRFDSYMNTYLIHHLFLEFLQTKQNILTDEEKTKTYKAAADWCSRNGFKIDALTYYEKAGNYEQIVLISFDFFGNMPYDIAILINKIIERAPSDTFKKVNLLATLHIHTIFCLGQLKKAMSLSRDYEQKLLKLPKSSSLRNSTLSSLYFLRGATRILMSIKDGQYDFDKIFAKMSKYLTASSLDCSKSAVTPVGTWVSLVGGSSSKAMQDYIEAISRSIKYVSLYANGGIFMGADELLKGELLFYQGDVKAAEPFAVRALEKANKHNQFEIANRAMFYLLRIAISRGDYKKSEQILKDMEAQLSEKDYLLRFTVYDIILGRYFCALRQPGQIPHWLKEKFRPYAYVHVVENFANQTKVRYCYLMKNYEPLLQYIEEMKQRESIIYGRVEMLAIEACVLYKTDNKTAAFKTLKEAYKAASPNNIVMSFAELGKDMRALAAAALQNPACGIPKNWLKIIKNKSTAYAKAQSLFINDYKKFNGITDEVLTERENEILSELYLGLSRTKIAEKKGVSINTINSALNNIFSKLGARNAADAVRIAAEKKVL